MDEKKFGSDATESRSAATHGGQQIPMKGNIMHRTTTRFGRRAFGLAAVGALALSACGSEEIARFTDTGGSGASDGGGAGASDGGGGASDGGGTGAATADLPQLEAGFTVENFTKDVTVSNTLQPQNNTVITPTGTLTIDGVQEIATVPAEAVDLEAEMDEDGEELDFAAAEGEVLRALDLSFAPEDDDDLAYDDGPPPTDLSIRAGGSQTHPADRDRADRVQEPHHTFPVSVEPFPVLYDGEPDDDIDATVSFQATTLTLTAWTEETGWAEPGGAWLVMDWSSEITVDTSTPGLVEAGSYSAVASVTVDGETTTDEVHADELLLSPSSNEEERTLVVPVSAEMSAATVSMSGEFSVEVDSKP